MLMKKFLRYPLVALLAVFCGNSFAQEVTFDFSDESNPWGLPTEKLEETGEFTYDGKTIVVTTSNYTRWFSDTKVLLFGKKDATITLPAFDFDVERIDVVGASGASGKVTFNIFVGDEAVSTEVTGAKETAIFKIAEGKQAAGTVYVIKNTNDNNNQISQILIWKKGTSGDTPEPKHIENTAETAYTVAQAIELIEAGESLSETVYIKGIVSQVDQFKDSYKSIDYWISDDGTTESAQFECYSGKGIDGADFESIDDIKVGAKVIVKGVMKKYKDTYEFDFNNELVSYEYTTDTWTVAGTVPLVDKSWDPSDASADMTSTDGVNFTYEKEGIVLEKGTEYKFKVAKNHSWDEAYPGSDYILTVDETATYTVTITFNASTTEVGVEKVKTGSASAVEHTYGLVGTLVGSWDDDVEMTKGDDGLYTAVVTDVAAGDYEFKVRADKSWDINYPSSNYQLTVEQDNSTVTVTFNEDTKEINAIVDAATGISTAKIVNMNEAPIFNLAGQRVEKVQKGIYIQDGKKFVVK